MPDETTAVDATPAPVVEAAAPPPAPAAEPTLHEAAVAAFLKGQVAAAAAAPAETTEAVPAVETPVTPPPTAPDVMSERLAKLIEAQKQTRLEREQFDAARKQHEADIAWAKKFQEDPLGAAAERGITYEKLTEMALDPKRAQLERTDTKTMTEVEQLRQRVAEMEKAAQQTKAEAQRQSLLSNAKALAATGDDFEYVRIFGAEDKALQLVENHYAQTGQLLGGGDINEAIKHAMTQIEKAYEADLERGLTAKKVKSKLTPVTTPPAVPAAANSGQRQPPKTLTNSQATASQPRAEPENLSADELRAKAIAILQRS